MFEGLVDTTARQDPDSGREYAVTGLGIAVVVSNIDTLGLGRVQVRLPWQPGFEPWARVAVPMAGMGRGTWIIPQPGDEVVVGFDHGDIREPYVLGSLWNTTDRPPALGATDAVTKRLVRTPLGHELAFDDAAQTVTLTSTTRQKVELSPTAITIATTGSSASITLGSDGKVTIKGLSIALEALEGITVKGGASVQVDALGSASVHAKAQVDIKAVTVTIN